MATGEPPIDVFNPILQALRDEFEGRYLAEDGLESCELDATREYTEAFKRPYVCALIADVLSGRWDLGSSQQDLADRLGIKDRSWVSDALRHGELSFDLFMRLRCCPTRPDDWDPLDATDEDMRRSGFISVARHMAAFVTDRAGLVPEELNELNYELVCELFGRFENWTAAQVNGNEQFALDLVTRVLRDPGRNVMPAWYMKRDRLQVEAKIAAMSVTAATAFVYLCTLQMHWLDVFVVSQCLVESIAWKRS